MTTVAGVGLAVTVSSESGTAGGPPLRPRLTRIRGTIPHSGAGDGSTAVPVSSQAQPFWAIYLGAGYNLPVDIGTTTNLVLPSTSTNLQTTGGFVGLASVGYAVGNGMRFEIEGNYR